MVEHSGGDDIWNTDDEFEIDNSQFSPETLGVLAGKGISDETFAHFIEMGFASEMIARAIEETGGANSELILETLFKFPNTSDGPSSSKTKVIGHLVEMGFPKENAIKAIQEYGDENMDELTNALLTYAEVEKMSEKINTNNDYNLYSLSSDDEPITNSKKRRVYNEPPRRERKRKRIRLPNPMIGFGVPNEPGIMRNRPVPIPVVARGPPYFYYEYVATAHKDVWAKISSHLYDIMPELVDSIYFCAGARKMGYVHNLPIHKRFQIYPTPHYTIQEALPLTKRWWPTWDKRLKLNCLAWYASAGVIKRLCDKLDRYDGEPPVSVQKEVLRSCRQWNLVWVGKNKLAPLEADEIEKILGFPGDHTRGGISQTDRYESLCNSFQVDTVAYHLSVLKPLFPNGINVLSLFTGIGGGVVALSRLQIRMNVVVSVEIKEVNRNILRSFWEQTNQTGILREFSDVRKLDNHRIERLMDEYGGFDLVIGGRHCNNLAEGSRISQVGDHSSLFFEYCRILETVRSKSARMGR